MPSYIFSDVRNASDSYITDIQISANPVTYAHKGGPSVTLTTDQAAELNKRFVIDLVGGSDGPSTTQVNDLIAYEVSKGRKGLELPAGTYDNSGANLVIPAGFEVWGESRDTTIILLPTSGTQMELQAYSRAGRFRFGPKVLDGSFAIGRSPNPSGQGVKMWSKAHMEDTFALNLHIAWNLWGDHISLVNNETVTCGVALFRSANGQPRGNLFLQRNRFTGCAYAAFFVTENIEEDSLESYSNSYSFCPYGWFANNSGGGQNEFGFTNVRSYNDSFESNGNRWVQLGSRKISGDFFGPLAGPLDASYTLVPGGTNATWDSLIIGPDRQYGFESGNVSGPNGSDNFNQFQIWGHNNPPDTSNGPMVTPGDSGSIFKKN